MHLLPAAPDSIWLHMLAVQVAMGAAEVLLDQLQFIRQLRPQGAQQLAADLEYFCNVLSALGVAAPAALATWQASPSNPYAHALCVLAIDRGPPCCACNADDATGLACS